MSDENKIIIDEDWKSQVEREKEQLEHAPEEETKTGAGQIPEASFSTVVTSIGTQALMMLGQIASDSGGRYVHITTAGHLTEHFDRALRKRRQYRQLRLYWPPLFWLLFVGVLTTEWILRRRFQLR